jgi:predicted anti-sigma-YlaC factor YlaD
MNCHRAREIMARKASREISSREDGLLKDHIAGCPECAGLEDQLERTWNALACHPAIEPSSEFLPKLRAKIARDRRRSHWNLRPVLKWQLGALAVCALVAAVFLTRAALYRHDAPAASREILIQVDHNRWDEQFLQDLDTTLQQSAADSLSAYDSWSGSDSDNNESGTARPKPAHRIMKKKEPA